MDTYENETLTPEEEEVLQPPVEEEIPESPAEEAAVQELEEDGFYHGAGAGVTETTAPAAEEKPEAQAQQPAQASAAEQTEPEETAAPARKKKSRVGRTVGICAIALVAALFLTLVGSILTGVVVSAYWNNRNETIISHFEARLEVLQEQLDQGGTTTKVDITEDGMSPSEVYEANIASVVAINCTSYTTSQGQTYQATSAGSGFVYSADGYIVTNHHVIEDASSISVIFADGTSLSATLIGSDSVNDIALLKVDATDLQPVTIGSSDALAVGNRVVAIGNALGELSFSLTVGYVSGMDREVTTDGTVINMIQTDVAINSGNSGGPLFNAAGEVVGITSAKYSGTTSSGATIEGISFAIPMDDVIGMLEDLKEVGYIRSAYLGITGYTAETTSGDQLGVTVYTVTGGSCAAKAGLRQGDIITYLGGYEISNLTDLQKALRQFHGGDSTTIEVLRNGRTVILEITLDEKTS